MEGTKLNLRVAFIGFMVVVLVVIIGGRLYNMQIVNGTTYSAQSEKSIARSVTVPAARGSIYDRYGRPLVTNRLSYNITIDEWMLKRADDISRPILDLISLCQLSVQSYTDTFPVTYHPYAYAEDMSDTQRSRLERFVAAMEWDENISAEELVEKLREYFKLPDDLIPRDLRRALGVLYEIELRLKVPTVPSYTFAEGISMDLVGRISEADLPGVQIVTVPIREYQTDYAAHILGRIGKIPEEKLDAFKAKGYATDEIVGIDGVEQAFEDWLHGTAGVSVVEINTSGKVQNVVNKTEAKPGSNVFLTIDIRLQEEVERLLEANILRMQAENKTLKGKEAEAGAAVVIDVNTGELLAMASYPTFSLKTFMADYADLLADPLKPLVSRSISGIYSPGSTYKMVTATAGLEESLITPSTKITDKGRYTFYKDYQPTCHVYPGSHGTITVRQALQKSCNYFFYDVGRQVGIDAQGYWARQFGLGEPTGIEIQGESLGYVAGPENSAALGLQWFPGLALASAIGQSDNSFTPLQIANYIATIANGGTLYRPHLLKEVKSSEFGQTVYESPAEVIRKLELQDSTVSVLQEGMRMVAQPGGTANSIFGNYPVAVAAKTGSVEVSSTPSNGVFVAYAPYDDPEIAVVIVIEKGGGGSIVAPAAKDIFDAYFSLQDEIQSVPAENALQR